MFGPFKKDLATPHSNAMIHKQRGKGARPFTPAPMVRPNDYAKPTPAPVPAPAPMTPPAPTTPMGAPPMPTPSMPTMGNSRVGGI